MYQPDFSRPLKTGTVSPLAARLSSVAYALGFVCLTPILFWMGGVPSLSVLGVLPSEQSGRVQALLLLVMLITSLPTIVVAIVALRLMRNISATLVQKDRATRAIVIAFIVLSFPLGALFIDLLSGGHF
jgi:hypothetical protein